MHFCAPREQYTCGRQHAVSDAISGRVISFVELVSMETLASNNNMISHEKVIILVFCYQKMSVGDVPYHLKFALKVTHPSLINADFDQYLLITSQP